MSVREQIYQLTESLPEYKLGYVLAYIQGLMAGEAEEKADDAYCERLLQDYLDDPDPHKHDCIPAEQLARELGISL